MVAVADLGCLRQGRGGKMKGHRTTGSSDNLVIAKKGLFTRSSLLEQHRKAAHHVFHTGRESERELYHGFSNGKAPWKAIHHK